MPKTPARRTLHRATAATALLAGLGTALLAVPASADPGGPAPTTSVVVTRLSIGAGHGWLTLQVRLGDHDSTGFEVDVPAGDGAWGGRSDVYVADLDAHCRKADGVDLHYTCASDDGSQLPGGGYQVTIPVTRTGTPSGLTGSAWVDTADGDGETTRHGTDTFPVYDDTHARSTAEVRTAPISRDVSGDGSGAATVAATTTVVPRDSVTALDVALPAGSGWRITGSNTSLHDVRCGLLGAATPTPSVHCVPTAAAGGKLPAGRYQLVLRLAFTGDTELATSQVALTTSSLGAEVQDTFDWTDVDLS